MGADAGLHADATRRGGGADVAHGLGASMQRAGQAHQCSMQARCIDMVRRPGVSTRCADRGYRHGAQARGIDVVHMPGVSARRGRGIGPSRRARGLDPVCRGRVLTQRVGALTQHAWVGLTQHAGVSTRHAGTGGVDAGQGCSQGEGGGSMRKRSPFDPLLGQGRAWLWRHEKKQNPHPLAFEARVGIGAREPSVSHLERGGCLSTNKACDFHVTLFGCWCGGHEGQLVLHACVEGGHRHVESESSFVQVRASVCSMCINPTWGVLRACW